MISPCFETPNGKSVSFQVFGDGLSLGLQQNPHEIVGNGECSAANPRAQVTAAARLDSTRHDEGGLCVCQRLRRQKFHELFWR